MTTISFLLKDVSFLSRQSFSQENRLFMIFLQVYHGDVIERRISLYAPLITDITVLGKVPYLLMIEPIILIEDISLFSLSNLY